MDRKAPRDNPERCGRIIRVPLIIPGSLSLSVRRGGPRVDARLDRHAGAEQADQTVIVEHDLYGDALDDLGEIAGGVVRRQEGEFEAARRGNTVHMALNLGAGEAIDRDVD